MDGSEEDIVIVTNPHCLNYKPPLFKHDHFDSGHLSMYLPHDAMLEGEKQMAH